MNELATNAPSSLAKERENSLRQIILRSSFIAVHFLPLLAFFTGATTFDWILCFVMYVLRMFFVTAGYHRYFSHRTFKTSRVFQCILAFLAETSAQKGVLWWSAHHRVHHKHSDKAEDPHSKKLSGFWHSHIGWVMSADHDETQLDMVKDLAKFPELMWLDRNYLVPPVCLLVFIYLLGAFVNSYDQNFVGFFSAGLSTVIIGAFLSTLILYHATFSINSVMHWYGKARYNTGDESKNSLLLAILSLGEGWHNNHHYYQSSTRQGFFWWEIDLTYYALKVMSWFGLVWELRGIPKHVMLDPKKLISSSSK